MPNAGILRPHAVEKTTIPQQRTFELANHTPYALPMNDTWKYIGYKYDYPLYVCVWWPRKRIRKTDIDHPRGTVEHVSYKSENLLFSIANAQHWYYGPTIVNTGVFLRFRAVSVLKADHKRTATFWRRVPTWIVYYAKMCR